MNLTTKTLSLSLTPGISDYLEKKLSALNKYVDLEQDNVFIHAVLGKTTQHHKSGDFFKVEVDLHIDGKQIHVEALKEDLYAAIDAVKDELAQEIKKNKDKRKSLIRRGASRIKNILKRGEQE